MFSWSPSALGGERDIETRTSLGRVIRGLGLLDVNNLDGVWGISRSYAEG